VLNKINNAESINENDLLQAATNLENIVSKNKNDSLSNLINPLINKILDYEFATKTESSTVTQKIPTENIGQVRQPKSANKALAQWKGNRASITGQDGKTTEGIIEIEDGKYYLFNDNGEKVSVIGEMQITDRDISLPSIEDVPMPILVEANGNVKSITLQLNKVDKENGGVIPDKKITVNFKDPEKALDYAIQLRAEQIGEVPDTFFEKAYEEVVAEMQKEVPLNDLSTPVATEIKTDTPNEETTTNEVPNTVAEKGTLAPIVSETETENTVNEKNQESGNKSGKVNTLKNSKSKLTDVELGVIRDVLESTIDQRQYPTFFDMNQTLVQQTAKTQGEGQERVPLDGTYVQAHLADLRSISLNNARVLQDALGNYWKEKMVNFFEENPKAGDIAVVSGILNVINTDINNEIAASKNGTEISKLNDLQARADRITYDTARSASLALNQRRMYQDFGQGKTVSDILSSIILTPEQQAIKSKVEEALKQKFTDEELNKPKSAKPKKSVQTKKQTAKNDDSVKKDLISKGKKAAQQTDADGNVIIVSLKDKINQANDALNGFKC